MHTPGSVTLTVFFELSAESRICDEDDIKHYYQSFLTIDLPLENKHTDDDFDAEIFKGFHADDHTPADQLFNTNPRHPANECRGCCLSGAPALRHRLAAQALAAMGPQRAPWPL